MSGNTAWNLSFLLALVILALLTPLSDSISLIDGDVEVALPTSLRMPAPNAPPGDASPSTSSTNHYSIWWGDKAERTEALDRALGATWRNVALGVEAHRESPGMSSGETVEGNSDGGSGAEQAEDQAARFDWALPTTFDHVAMGGTFDRLHSGHMLLLAVAALVTIKRLYVGVTGQCWGGLRSVAWEDRLDGVSGVEGIFTSPGQLATQVRGGPSLFIWKCSSPS